MNRAIPFTLALSGALFFASAHATDTAALKGCAAKEQNVRNQIARAESAGNSSEVSGLKKALEEIQDHCTEAGLKRERENKVLEAKHEVSERQADLDKAMKKGDAEKINKRKEKLAESRKELQDAVDQLDK